MTTFAKKEITSFMTS